MHRFFLIVLAVGWLSTSNSTETIATSFDYNAVAHFTSGVFNGNPIDVIEKADLKQDRIVLYVRWSNMQTRSYFTKVRILGPSGELIRKMTYSFEPANRSHNSWHWYQPNSDDPTGIWIWEFFVDGDKAFDALIPVGSSQ